MTIKEISEKYHITADTLRYYERVGMIPPVTRTASGIRDYGITVRRMRAGFRLPSACAGQVCRWRQ